ncbi:MAG: hypothetical protein R3209_01090 [Salinimicrobium sediminis]|nr:hypothetical protein [Salinimicrobium sediminis]MDX1753820.1 hypothetical protein [Salinimicrobium sediminis]
MAKLYSEKKVNKMSPKKETINFLLNYSRALRISTYKNIQFENILN